MIELARYRPIAIVLASLVAAAAAIDATLSATLGRPSRWFPDERDNYDWFFIEKAAGRFASAAALKKQDPGASLGIILGMSTVNCSVSPAGLERDDNLPIRWMMANGFGGGVPKVVEFADLLARSGLRPDVVVLGIDPLMMRPRGAREDEEPEGSPGALARDLAAGRLKDAARELKGIAEADVWTLADRFYVKQVFRRAMMDVRLRLLAAAGLGAEVGFVPADDPWTPIAMDETTSATQAELDMVMRHWAESGHFDPAGYAPDRTYARELVAMVAAFRGLGAKVVVVSLPLKSTVRSRLPAEARRLLPDVLARAFGDDAPPVVDLTDAVPDAMFRNHSHVGPAGRAALTPLLARRLGAILDPPAPARPR